MSIRSLCRNTWCKNVKLPQSFLFNENVRVIQRLVTTNHAKIQAQEENTACLALNIFAVNIVGGKFLV